MFDHRDREVIVGLLAAVLVVVDVGVGVEGEGAVDAVGERTREHLVCLPLVPLAQQGRCRRQRAALGAGHAALLGVDVEEGVLGGGVGEEEDDDHRDQHGAPGGDQPHREAGCERTDDRERPTRERSKRTTRR